MSYKKTKKELKEILTNNSAEYTAEQLSRKNPEKLINPTIGLLYETDEKLKFKAVELLGIITKNIDIEKKRILMRRFMWNLNDESGGIGWGSAEAMAVMAFYSDTIYNEFISILASYIDPESGTHLDHEALHPGVIWGLGKLGEKEKTKKHAQRVLKLSIKSKNPKIRGMSVWACEKCKIKSLEKDIETLENDDSAFSLFEDQNIKNIKISQAAKRALSIIKQL